MLKFQPQEPGESDDAYVHRLMEYFSQTEVWSDGSRTDFMPDHGTEWSGDLPSSKFGHDAYSRIRRLAWEMRAERNLDVAFFLEIAIVTLRESIMRRPGVDKAAVQQAVDCLLVDRCPCPSCRYSF